VAHRKLFFFSLDYGTQEARSIHTNPAATFRVSLCTYYYECCSRKEEAKPKPHAVSFLFPQSGSRPRPTALAKLAAGPHAPTTPTAAAARRVGVYACTTTTQRRTALNPPRLTAHYFLPHSSSSFHRRGGRQATRAQKQSTCSGSIREVQEGSFSTGRRHGGGEGRAAVGEGVGRRAQAPGRRYYKS